MHFWPRYAPYVLRMASRLSRQSQKYHAAFRKLREEFYKKLWYSTAQELGAEIKDIGYGYLNLSLNSHSTLVRGDRVMLDNQLTLEFTGNKPLIHKILKEHDCPVVRYIEFNFAELGRARAFLAELAKPGVVKPADAGSAGRGITTGIKTHSQLRQAALWASCFSKNLVLEEQVEGDSYRLLYLHGRYLDAIRRHPPRVCGDGKSTIRQLIAIENQRRAWNGSIVSLHPISIDAELKNHLLAAGYSLQHVLKKDETVVVKRVVNQNSRFENESVREIVHSDTIRMGGEICGLLQIELAGIDIISKDITQPLRAGNGVINEVNTTPGLHHHYLISRQEEVTPVALLIQRSILNAGK